ncbi:MAG: aminopeptidase [Nevskiales bacterium]
MQRAGLGLFLALGLALLPACSTLGYYAQAARGQLDLLTLRQPLAQVLADETTPAETRRLLGRAQAMRRFAVEALGLPDNASYSSYADLKRTHVVWNVVATPEFSLEPIQSCFLLIGCLNYRGYFSEAQAQAQADALRVQGYDVIVSGSAAYSTLGWFEDPLLSTMLRWDEARLAAVMFHELAHQKLYLPGDSDFNESFASVVEEVGARRWLSQHASAEALAAWETERLRQRQFTELVAGARSRLQRLYATSVNDADKRRAKVEIFRDLQQKYAELKQSWQGHTGYDRWFAELNNAKVAAVSTYHAGVPALRHLLGALDEDLQRFYRAAENIAAWPAPRRQRWLAEGGEAAVSDFSASVR